jgi:cytochrome c-type biogenesis protein CcmF
MAFAADPMEASVSAPRDGLGLSPLLQHPAMLIHPPIVFLGYALWTVPFALAGVALLTGRLDAHWVRQARPWALVAWTVLGVGILWGADWAYEELGWGGYWAWDPVENGSLIPWLTGTALIHSLMAWQHGRVLKKTTVCLAVATFALCNFATFLTRSGIFSSLHAFSESPIGWLFLALMIGLAASGAWGLVVRRAALAPERPIRSVFSREAFVLVAAVALVLLAAIAVAGTLSSALSNLVVGRAILVGPAFYNNVLIPTGLTLLLTTAAAPLLRWGDGPSREQKRYLLAAVCGGGVAAATAAACGTYHPINLAVIGGSALAVLAFAGGVILDGKRAALGVLQALGRGRRQYAGFLMHLGFVCLAIGVTGSSLGKREQGFTMTEGQTVEWAGRSIRLARVFHRELPDKLVAEAELEVSRGGRWETTLTPAQHFHRLQREWTTEVAIHSTWSGDFYTILHSGTDEGQLSLTFVENPLMRWMWLGGGVIVLGTVVRLWPTRRRAIRRGAADKRARQQVAEQTSHRSPVPPPHRTRKHARRWAGEP